MCQKTASGNQGQPLWVKKFLIISGKNLEIIRNPN